jgi:hypothetical protein
MNNIKLLSSPRQHMRGTIYVYWVLKLWMSSTMPFIRYALSSDFVREPTEAEKIEKTLFTMLPSERIITQQYREKNFTVYSSLIQTLKQAEKNHELKVWNSNGHCTTASTCKCEEKWTQWEHTDWKFLRQGKTQQSQKATWERPKGERYF